VAVSHPCYRSAQWRKVRLQALKRAGWMCEIRGPDCLGAANEGDHIIPLEAGGAWYDLENVRAACGVCNRQRERKRRTSLPSREWV
jgi:5-methylcytosine-specific restriction endonuclease McrA